MHRTTARLGSAALAAAIACGGGPIACRPADAIPRVVLLDGFRIDHDAGREWTPDHVVALLASRRDAWVFAGNFAGLPIGSPVLLAVGARIDAWQAAIRAAEARPGAGAPDPGRICVDWRPDLVLKHIDGSRGEVSCGSLVDADQCAPNPCWASHPDNPCARWHGDMEAHWGEEGRFDPDWLLRTPAATWDGIVAASFDGEDFCTGSGHDWGGADRRAICAANSAAERVVLYTDVDGAARRIRSVSGVALDLRVPEARRWNARRLVSKLSNLGIDPGEAACVLVGYKPGLWSYYQGRRIRLRCPAAGARSWSGYLTPQNAWRCPGPQRVVPNPYGPGEFEAAMNEQMREVFRLLDAPVPEALARARGGVGSDYSRIRFLFTERPTTRGELWWIWDEDIRSSEKVLGEMERERAPVDPRPMAPGLGAARGSAATAGARLESRGPWDSG